MKVKFFLLTILLILATNVNAALIGFTGTLGYIEIDNGSSIYSSLSVDDSLFGGFTIGNSASDASSIDMIAPTAMAYNFTGAPYGGVITDGSTVTVGVDSSVGIGDNDGIGDDTYYLNNLYGTAIPYETISDTWDISTSNGTQSFGVTLYSLDTNAFTGLDYQVLPYALEQADYAIFYIEDTDSTGTTYLATGFLTQLIVVPIPAAAWLFGSGLLGLIGFTIRKKA